MNTIRLKAITEKVYDVHDIFHKRNSFFRNITEYIFNYKDYNLNYAVEYRSEHFDNERKLLKWLNLETTGRWTFDVIVDYMALDFRFLIKFNRPEDALAFKLWWL